MGSSMSLKLHYQHSHLEYFSEDYGDVSDQHDKRFHQIANMEKKIRVTVELFLETNRELFMKEKVKNERKLIRFVIRSRVMWYLG